MIKKSLEKGHEKIYLGVLGFIFSSDITRHTQKLNFKGQIHTGNSRASRMILQPLIVIQAGGSISTVKSNSENFPTPP